MEEGKKKEKEEEREKMTKNRLNRGAKMTTTGRNLVRKINKNKHATYHKTTWVTSEGATKKRIR